MAKICARSGIGNETAAAAGEGETVVEGDEDRFLVVPRRSNSMIDMALEATTEYLGLRYTADQVINAILLSATTRHR